MTNNNEDAKAKCSTIKDDKKREECFEQILCPGQKCPFRAKLLALIYGPAPIIIPSENGPVTRKPEDILTREDVIFLQNLYQPSQEQQTLTDTTQLLPMIQRLQEQGFHRAAIAGAELLVDIEAQQNEHILLTQVRTALEVKANALDAIGKHSAALSTRSLTKFIR